MLDNSMKKEEKVNNKKILFNPKEKPKKKLIYKLIRAMSKLFS